MPYQEYKAGLSGTLRLVPVVEMAKMLGVPRETFYRLMNRLGIKPLTTPDEDGNTQHRISALSFELALLHLLLPGGPGYRDPNTEPGFTDLVDAVDQGYEIFAALDYWELFKKRPHELQLMMGLAALTYGNVDDHELNRQLAILGECALRRSHEECMRAIRASQGERRGRKPAGQTEHSPVVHLPRLGEQRPGGDEVGPEGGTPAVGPHSEGGQERPDQDRGDGADPQ